MRDFVLAAAAVLVLVVGIAVIGGRLPGAGDTTKPSPAVTSAQEAAAVAIAQDPRFAGLGPRDPGLIGQGSWWEVATVDDGYHVTIQIGWDDCQAGCIYRHTWVYVVRADGSAGLLSEEGPPLPVR
jgi:hypothetical protein